MKHRASLTLGYQLSRCQNKPAKVYILINASCRLIKAKFKDAKGVKAKVAVLEEVGKGDGDADVEGEI